LHLPSPLGPEHPSRSVDIFVVTVCRAHVVNREGCTDALGASLPARPTSTSRRRLPCKKTVRDRGEGRGQFPCYRRGGEQCIAAPLAPS